VIRSELRQGHHRRCTIRLRVNLNRFWVSDPGVGRERYAVTRYLYVEDKFANSGYQIETEFTVVGVPFSQRSSSCETETAVLLMRLN
jgi:hypothetical protein